MSGSAPPHGHGRSPRLAPSRRGERLRLAVLVAVALGLVACGSNEEAAERTDAARASTVERAPGLAPGVAEASGATASAGALSPSSSVSLPDGPAPDVPAESPTPAQTVAQFRALIEQLSEPGADFFSDNFITNETSYLQASPPFVQLVRPGGVYVGVGPEQNYTYIAQSRPSMAYLVDIRRANLVLHLLYKAIFDLARSRSEFLTLLLGLPYDAESTPADDAPLEQVLAHVERQAPSEQSPAETQRRIRQRIEEGYGIALSRGDTRDLRAAHRAFQEKQLALRFELKEASSRRYPTLRELLAARDPGGRQSGFLADERSFRFVQRMHREHRIVPIVGDFGGSKALLALADHLKRSGQTVSTFYVSNVEQYLFEQGVWHRWVRNVRALPTDEHSLFLRCYLDQGRRHPRQMPAHRTTTVLQRIADFLARDQTKPYRSMWAVSTDEWLPDGGVGLTNP